MVCRRSCRTPDEEMRSGAILPVVLHLVCSFILSATQTQGPGRVCVVTLRPTTTRKPRTSSVALTASRLMTTRSLLALMCSSLHSHASGSSSLPQVNQTPAINQRYKRLPSVVHEASCQHTVTHDCPPRCLQQLTLRIPTLQYS